LYEVQCNRVRLPSFITFSEHAFRCSFSHEP
jgi:hypothetical protein